MCWRRQIGFGLAVTVIVAVHASPASAQTAPGQTVPVAPDPRTTIPERIEPSPGQTQPGTQSGENLSERLDRNSGVIRPPSGADPGISVRVPDPGPNTTPVIPPPGTPGGDQSVQPK